MAIEIFNDGRAASAVIIAQLNAVVDEIARINSKIHYDVSSTRGGSYDAPTAIPIEIEAANATNLATALTLADEIKLKGGWHWRDAFAHATPTPLSFTAPDPTDEGTLVTWCIELKTKYNAHLEDTDAHQETDVTHAISASNPTNTAECVTLLNEAKADLNAHILDAPTAKKIKTVG